MKISEVLGWGVLVVIILALGAYALLYTTPMGNPYTASSTTAADGGALGAGGASGAGSGGNAGGPVTFYCTEGSFTATFSADAVQIDLDNGRYFALPRAASGSGIRYEGTVSGKDELLTSEGSWAALSEDGEALYSNCIAAQVSESGGAKTFIDESGLFSFKFPDAFSIVGTEPGYTQSWMVNATTSGMLLAEVQLPASAMPKTNFGGADFTVGVSSDPSAIASCLSYNPTGAPGSGPVTALINGVTFDKFTSHDIGAGNLYDTTSYRLIRDGECYALEYTIHSTQIANYPKGTVTAFNAQQITKELDGIATSFQFLQ
ncbi:MAG TPA: MliC family protein [Candidatus Paceibacterota bacterium]|nr:MliC family protein [Candidatus Paceibacterota bacterium]